MKKKQHKRHNRNKTEAHHIIPVTKYLDYYLTLTFSEHIKLIDVIDTKKHVKLNDKTLTYVNGTIELETLNKWINETIGNKYKY